MEFSGLRVDDKLVADVTAFGQTNWVWLTAGSVACVLLTFFWRRPRQPKPPKPVDPRLRTYNLLNSIVKNLDDWTWEKANPKLVLLTRGDVVVECYMDTGKSPKSYGIKVAGQ
jgi:hypothetical protein